MEKLMNEENEWDHRISVTVKEGPADCIRIDEVAAALKKMKRHKAPGLSGLVAEMMQPSWREIVENDSQTCGLNREDAMDCIRRRKQIRDD